MNSQWRSLLTVALPGLLSVMILGGCASPTDDDTQTVTPSEAPAAESPVTSAADVAAAPEDCDLLGAEQVTALAGRALDGPRSVTVAGADGMPACLWGDFEATAVQVARVPAEDWAQQLPAALEQAEASGMLDDAENTRKIREASELISAGGRLDAGQACAMFSTMLEISGTEAGLSTTINLVPTQEAPQAISAQSCNVGVFSSVLVVKDGITGSDEEIATVGQALALVEEAEV